MLVVVRMIGRGGVHVPLDDPTHCLPRLDVHSERLEPDFSAQRVAAHVNLDDARGAEYTQHRETGKTIELIRREWRGWVNSGGCMPWGITYDLMLPAERVKRSASAAD